MRLLLVEDDTLIAAGIREALLKADYQVDVLHQGQQVASVLADGIHDLLILDLGRPDRVRLTTLR